MAGLLSGSTTGGGAPGPGGNNGATWRSGSGVPANALGADGDFYLNTANSDVYLKTAGVYAVSVNIKGATGTAGSNGTNGTNGTNGAAGAVWRNGAGAPANGTGIDGDYYLNNTNGDVYIRVTGVYSAVANIKGANGSNGVDGAAGAGATIKGLAEYGSLSTQALIRTALDAFFADTTANEVIVPEITISEPYARVLTDGQHKVIRLSQGTRLNLTTASSSGTIFEFSTLPVWTVAVSSVARVTGISLVDSTGDAATSNTVDRLTIASAQTVAKHDILKLISDDVCSNGAHAAPNYIRLGEFGVVGTASTGTTITLTGPLRETRDTYATNVRVCKMPNASVQIHGGRGSYDSSLASSSAGNVALMRFYGLRDVKVTGFSVDSALAIGIKLYSCYNYLIDGCTFGNHRNAPNLSQYGYGVSDNACEGGKVTNCDFFGLRHGFTTNGAQIATNLTGKSVWVYGRSRNFNVGTGCTALACSNSPYDTHCECDGGIFSGFVSHGTYDGASSAGASLQVRGENITVNGGHGEGSYGGAWMRCSKGGRLSNYTSLHCRTYALVCGSGDSTTAQDAENAAVGCRLGVLDINQPVVNITVDTGKSNKTEIISSTLQVKTTSALAYQSVITVNNDLTTLYLDDVLIDLTQCFAGTTVSGLISVADGQTVKGKIRVRNTANCTVASIIRLRSGATSNATIDLEVQYESTGSNGITNCTAALPNGLSTTTFTAAKVKATIKTTSGTDRTTLRYQIVPTAASTINLKGNGEPAATYRLAPTAALTGANAVTLTGTDVPEGYYRTFTNASAFAVEFISGLAYTLPAGEAVTVVGTGTAYTTVGVSSSSGAASTAQIRLLNWSVTPVTTTTSSTSEITLATVSVASGHGIVAGSRIIVTTNWSASASNGTHTARVKISGTGTSFLARAETATNLSFMRRTEIVVIDPTNALESTATGGSTDFGATTGARASDTSNVTGAFTLVITGQCASALDTFTLRSYFVEVHNPA